jgi:hypothetical protein
LKDLGFLCFRGFVFEDYICVHNGHVDFAQLVKRSTCSSRWIRFVFFFFFALWCWAIMRLQHQLTPTAVRHLRHLLLLGEFPTCTFLSFLLLFLFLCPGLVGWLLSVVSFSHCGLLSVDCGSSLGKGASAI